MTLKRRIKAGVVESFVTLCLFTAGAYGAKRFYDDFRAPYELQKGDGAYYLIEKDTGKRKMITQDFQLGSIEYRLKGLAEEGKQNVKDAIDGLAERYAR